MGPVSSIVAWIGFGVVAAITAMILPHNRGVRGIAINLFAGVAGALGFGALGRALGLYHTHHAFGFVFAATGALVTLFAYHAAWNRAHMRRPRDSRVTSG